MSGIDVEFIGNIDNKILESECLLDTNKKSNTIAFEVVQNIVENALDVASDFKQETIGDIVNQYTPRCMKDFNEKSQKKLTPTEEEVKKFIGEFNSSPPSKGVGDQLLPSKEVLPKKKSFTLPGKHFSLERKARLTDLVKNSKSLISRFLNQDTIKQTENEWEEKNEQFLKSIELNSITPSSSLKRKEKESSIDEEFLEIPNETLMDNIDLSKGDFPLASCSRFSSSQPDLQKVQQEQTKERKKWNIKAKIVNYIRKKSILRKETAKSE